ncbi:MAG TPA: SPOR domain-containing protein [Rhodanobacteraceae bacterium]
MQPALKTRLLGAFVIVALIVIVVPMFFSGEPAGGGQNISLKIPSPPDQKLQTRTLSLTPNAPGAAGTVGAAGVVTPSTGSGKLATVTIASRVPPDMRPELGPGQASTAAGFATAKAPSVTAAAPVVVSKSDATPTSTTVPAPTAKPVAAAPAPATPPATTPEPTANPGRAAGAQYSIHLGAYAQKANAERLVTRVGKLGYQAHVSAVRIGGKPAASVDVGPFASRASAETARLKLHAALPHAPARLVPVTHDQPSSAPASALPAKRAGGWAVQVVAYSQKSEAVALRDRLRKAGFASYVDDVRSGGATLWRVRVGPLAQREAAVTTLGRIKSQFPRLGGVVVTVP